MTKPQAEELLADLREQSRVLGGRIEATQAKLATIIDKIAAVREKYGL